MTAPRDLREGSVVDLRSNKEANALLAAYLEARDLEGKYAQAKRVAKARLLAEHTGDAEVALFEHGVQILINNVEARWAYRKEALAFHVRLPVDWRPAGEGMAAK